MAYVTHLRWRISGYLGGDPGPEIFSTGFATDIPTDFAGLPTDAQIAGVSSAIFDWWSASAAHIGAEAQAKLLTVSLIGPDGHVVVDGSGAFVQKVVPCEVHGTTAEPTHPWQIANVLSLITTRHGPRGKGRMYLPIPAFAISGGKVDASQRAAALNTAATAMGAINSALEVDGAVGPFHVAVASSLGEIHPVTQLRMGRVLDTQRRRRDALTEEYLTVSI